MSEITPLPPPTDVDRRNFDTVLPLVSEKGKIGLDAKRGHVTRWEIKDKDGNFVPVLYVGTELKRTGIPNLFPNYDASGGAVATHGFGRDASSEWQLVDQDNPRKLVMRLTPENISEEAKSSYPHNFETLIEVEIDDDGNMTHTMKVKNNGSEPMPVAPGHHPYFAVAHENKGAVTTNITGFEEDKRNGKFDWDEHPPDDEYDFPEKAEGDEYPKATIEMPDKTITIEDLSPVDENGRRVVEKIVAWSQPESKPDKNFLCFEPVTRGKGKLATDPIMIGKGQTWEMKVKYSTQLKQQDASLAA